MLSEKELKDVLAHFAIKGEPQKFEQIPTGHINLTYRVFTGEEKYVMQRISTTAFHDIPSLMRNISLVTEFLRERGIETLQIIPTLEGEPYCTDSQNGPFRVYKLIENVVSYDLVPSTKVMREAGAAFGQFQNVLSDFDATQLAETIVNFHNTPIRYQNLVDAIERDAKGRAAEVSEEIAFFKQRADQFSKVVDGIADGSIPVRVTHNDTKLNNILMDEETGKARAIIDLDTVMPGSLLYDFGDAMRSGATTALEDEADLSKVHFAMELFQAYTEGFLGELHESITPAELDLLAFSARLLTSECAMRFLTDYLDGDVYFATKYPEHNLVRTRNQIALIKDMEANDEAMRQIVKEAYTK